MLLDGHKQTVVLFGASGSMGHEAFKELWKRRENYNIVLLLLPSPVEKKLFKEYEKEAVRGADWVLNAMALISPLVDYYPEAARCVNIDGIPNIIKAIEAQPHGPDRIKYIHTGTVAETGDRLPPIHVGRVGDPLPNAGNRFGWRLFSHCRKGKLCETNPGCGISGN